MIRPNLIICSGPRAQATRQHRPHERSAGPPRCGRPTPLPEWPAPLRLTRWTRLHGAACDAERRGPAAAPLQHRLSNTCGNQGLRSCFRRSSPRGQPSVNLSADAYVGSNPTPATSCDTALDLHERGLRAVRFPGPGRPLMTAVDRPSSHADSTGMTRPRRGTRALPTGAGGRQSAAGLRADLGDGQEPAVRHPQRKRRQPGALRALVPDQPGHVVAARGALHQSRTPLTAHDVSPGLDAQWGPIHAPTDAPRYLAPGGSPSTPSPPAQPCPHMCGSTSPDHVPGRGVDGESERGTGSRAPALR